MRVIWKFTLKAWEKTVPMPDEAEVLSCDFQGELLQVWAMVDPSKPPRDRGFSVIPTGHMFGPPIGELVGIAHHREHGLVFHVFDHGYRPTPPPVCFNDSKTEA